MRTANFKFSCDVYREGVYMPVISGRSRGGDVCTHNLPLTGIYKGIFAQVHVVL